MMLNRLPVLALAAIACGESSPRAKRGEDSLPIRSGGPPIASLAVTIDSGGIGPIRLGMTLDSARKAVPRASFTRTSDGDGATLVDITLGKDSTIVVSADETTEEIDWTRRIGHLETSSGAFRTLEGIHAGSLVADAENAYGKVTEIFISEIESRQFVRFARQPAGLTFRIDYSGDFERESRRTTKYKPGARIFTIAVSRY